MEASISFPHLGITFSDVGKSVSIFGLDIAFYGIVIAVGMIAGICLALWTARKTGQDPDLYFDFAILAIICALIGARVYYVIFSWDYYKDHLLEILNFRGGGLAIYGGVLGGILTGIVFSRVRKIPVLRLLDTAAVGMITGQIIGRWGNFFNREAFGGYTDGLFAMRLPLEAVRDSEVTGEMLENMLTIKGILFIQVHPTFLYESLWNLLILGLMLAVTLWYRKRFCGLVVFLYLTGYGLGRIWIEELRTDQLLWPGTNVAVSQVLSGILVLTGFALIIRGFIRNRKAWHAEDHACGDIGS